MTGVEIRQIKNIAKERVVKEKKMRAAFLAWCKENYPLLRGRLSNQPAYHHEFRDKYLAYVAGYKAAGVIADELMEKGADVIERLLDRIKRGR